MSRIAEKLHMRLTSIEDTKMLGRSLSDRAIVYVMI